MLAEALQLLVPMQHLQPHIDKFDEEFERCYLAKMRKKVGNIFLNEFFNFMALSVGCGVLQIH